MISQPNLRKPFSCACFIFFGVVCLVCVVCSWNGDNNVGLVVGATDADALARVRAAAPGLWILAPGTVYKIIGMYWWLVLPLFGSTGCHAIPYGHDDKKLPVNREGLLAYGSRRSERSKMLYFSVVCRSHTLVCSGDPCRCAGCLFYHLLSSLLSVGVALRCLCPA